MKFIGVIAAVTTAFGASLIATSPAQAAGCYPVTGTPKYELMLVGGAPYNTVFKTMVNGNYYDSPGCLYEYRGYATDNKTRFPNFHKFIYQMRG